MQYIWLQAHYARLTSKLLVFHVGRSLYIAGTEREYEGSSCSMGSVMGLPRHA